MICFDFITIADRIEISAKGVQILVKRPEILLRCLFKYKIVKLHFIYITENKHCAKDEKKLHNEKITGGNGRQR